MYTIREAKAEVKNAIRGYLFKDEQGNYVMQERNREPLYLEGPPGVGKTEIVAQICEELGIEYVSFSMVHHTRNSLLGLPVISDLPEGGKYTSYTMSEVIAKVKECEEKGCKEGVLLLDEFNCMSDTIRPTMLSFLQTKNIGLHTLPEGWVIVLCGNPTEYNRSASRFDSAILDRIRVLPIVFDAKSFITYGKEIGLDKRILDYLELNPTHAYRCKEERGEKELVTCRGWENLSHAYGIYQKLGQGIDVNFVKQFIKSEEIAESFVRFEKQYYTGVSLEDVEEILEGRAFEKHRRQVMALSYKQKWQLTELLCERVTTKETAEEVGMGRYREISGWLNNMLEILISADEGKMLSEKVFFFINKSELLTRVVSNVKTEKYLVLCDEFVS